MSLNREKALEAIFSAIEELNMQLSDESKIPNKETTALFGESTSLDSLSLVNLVMMVEQNIAMETGEEVLLASEAAMSRKRSPYLSVSTLADYAVEVASDNNG